MEQNTVVIERPDRKTKFSQSFFMKYGLKIILGIIVVIVFLTAVQCTVKKPESPTWTTNLVLPVINRTYNMDELVGKIDQPGLSLEANDEILFTFEEALDTIKLEEDLTVNDIADTLTDSIGQITLQPDTPDPMIIYASEFGYSSELPLVPKGWLSNVNVVLPSFDIFNWVTISTGSLTIEVINELGLDLDSAFIILNDLDSNRVISVTELSGDPAMPDGDTTTINIDLASRTISNRLGITISCHTPGKENWWHVSGKKMTLSVGFENGITVSAAEAEIPSIPAIDLSEKVALNSDHTIVSADLASGNLQLLIENGSNLLANLSLSLPDFTSGGSAFSLDTSIAPQAAINININLASYTFAPTDQTAPQEIDIIASISIPGSSQKVVMSRYDMFRVIATVSNLQFDSMNAIINPIEMSFDDIDTVDLDIPEGFDELQLANAVLTLEIESAVNFPCSLDITINGDGSQIPIHIADTISTGNFSNPVTTIIIDSNLSSFLNPVPAYVTVSGAATLGDGGTVGTITRNDYILASITITSPLEVIIDSLTIAGDTTSENINQDDIDAITEHFIEGNFQSTIDNSLPLGVHVEMYFDGDSTKLNENAQLVKSLQVGADTISQLTFSLDSNEIKILENDPLYITQNITLIGNGSQPVKIFRSDRIIIQGTINVEYKFDGEF